MDPYPRNPGCSISPILLGQLPYFAPFQGVVSAPQSQMCSLCSSWPCWPGAAGEPGLTVPFCVPSVSLSYGWDGIG